MKKILLFFSMLFVAVSAAFAQKSDKPHHLSFGPKEAYTMIAGIQSLAPVDTVTSISLAGDYSLTGIKEVKVENLDNQQIASVQNDIFRILDRMPISSVVNGGTNGLSTGIFYSKPLSSGLNEILLVAISRPGGFAQIDYGVADDATVQMIRNSAFTLNGMSVTMSVQQSSNNYLIDLDF